MKWCTGFAGRIGQTLGLAQRLCLAMLLVLGVLLPAKAVEAAPAITNIAPASGPMAGSTEVTITGTNLTGATVNFGTVEGTITANTGTTITVTSPSVTTAGPVDITVVTPGGTSANTAADDFRYLAPPTATVEFLQSSILNNGVDQGTYRVKVTNPNAVTLSGVGFSQTFPNGLFYNTLSQTDCGGDATSRDQGGYSFANRALDANQSCVVTVSIGSNTPNTCAVTLGSLSSAAGLGTLPTAATLTVRPPVPIIRDVSPNVGPLAGTTLVTITGLNFLNATQVDFGGTVIAAADFTRATDTAIVVNSPAAPAKAVDITVTKPNGADTRTGAFAYGVVPTLTAFTHPTTIPYNSGGAVASSIDAAA